MNEFGLTFHHLGLAVAAPSGAIRFLSGLNYTIGDETIDELQNVRLRLCTSDDMPAMELIYPLETPGPLDNMLKNAKEMIYHNCYETESISDSVNAIKNHGLRVITISDQKPAILFGNRPVAFYYVPGFGLIELLQRYCSTANTFINSKK